MDSTGVVYILIGSTLGLILRLFIKYISRKNNILYLNNSTIVNVLASLFLGIFVGFKSTNKELLLFFYVGFLGCFSTFSSFIYQLFNLIKNRKYTRFFLYYIEVLILSILFFCIGNFVILSFKN